MWVDAYRYGGGALIVYLIRNTLNGKCYIGKTTRTLRERWLEHCRDARNFRACLPMYVDIRLHSPSAFAVEVLGEAKCQRDLNRMERKFIRLYHAQTEGYNQASAGGGCKPRRCTFSNYTLPITQRERIAESVRLSWVERRKQKEAAA